MSTRKPILVRTEASASFAVSRRRFRSAESEGFIADKSESMLAATVRSKKRGAREGSHNEGFTLIELIATLLVLIAVVQVFILIAGDISSSSLVRDNLIAANLTQEGIEVARNIRDRDWFLGNSFGASLPDGTWRVQWNSTSLLALDTNPVLKKDTVSGFFSYDTGADTIFKRTVSITAISSQEIRITSTVTWDFKNSFKNITAEEHLFNWFK
ncbi:MAG: hypothetical protein HYT63_01840 [Candidatus Yanofskybacteria bacterium]|nr:hypothetical protein [Candidatus Yanofskybacteria bacterium]